MSASDLLAGAALGAVATAVAVRRRIPPAPPAPLISVPDPPDPCRCGCVALRVQLAHHRQQNHRLRLAVYGDPA